MANIQERRNKDGKLISYSIRVHRGRGADGRQLEPWTATFDVSPTWTEKSAKKQAPKGTCFSVGFSGLLVQIGRLQRFRGEGDAGQGV